MSADSGGGSTAAQLQQLIHRAETINRFLEAFAGYTSRVFNGRAALAYSLTMLRGQGPATVAVSPAEVKDLDEVQYRFGEGPCLQAIRTGGTIVINDSRTDSRWPRSLTAIS